MRQINPPPFNRNAVLRLVEPTAGEYIGSGFLARSRPGGPLYEPTSIITAALIGAAVGAVGAAVTGGNILKGALLGAVSGAIGGWAADLPFTAPAAGAGTSSAAAAAAAAPDLATAAAPAISPISGELGQLPGGSSAFGSGGNAIQAGGATIGGGSAIGTAPGAIPDTATPAGTPSGTGLSNLSPDTGTSLSGASSKFGSGITGNTGSTGGTSLLDMGEQFKAGLARDPTGTGLNAGSGIHPSADALSQFGTPGLSNNGSFQATPRGVAGAPAAVGAPAAPSAFDKFLSSSKTFLDSRLGNTVVSNAMAAANKAADANRQIEAQKAAAALARQNARFATTGSRYNPVGLISQSNYKA